MKEGAFALIDCLGFKGIWNRTQNPDLILENLVEAENKIRKNVEKVSGFINNMQFKIVPQISLLSDTVAISITNENSTGVAETEEFRNGLLIEAACVFAASTMKVFIEDEPHLPMRGFITYGRHAVSKNFIVGPAVDEAAENYEIADGAFVWLHPNALEILDKTREIKQQMFPQLIAQTEEFPMLNMSQNPKKDFSDLFRLGMDLPVLMKDYDIPVKGGSRLKGAVVNPLLLFKNEERRADITHRYLNSFESRKIDVLLKKQNTLELLLQANDQCRKFDEKNIDLESMKKLLNIKDEKSSNPS